IPHSYGASFSGVGFFGASRCAPRTLTAPNPAPSPIIRRIGTQPCMRPKVGAALVNSFSRRTEKKSGHQKRDGMKTMSRGARTSSAAGFHRRLNYGMLSHATEEHGLTRKEDSVRWALEAGSWKPR